MTKGGLLLVGLAFTFGWCVAQTPSRSAMTTSRGAAPSRASTQGTVLIGKLGQTLREAAIRRSASDRAARLYTARAFEYVVLQTTRSPEWFAVVMENRQLGFVRASAVVRLPYDVNLRPGRGSRSAVVAGVPGGTPVADGSVKGQLAQYALNYTGTPYTWGGNSLQRGIDCSGFVQQLFGKIGVELPRTAAQQALVGQSITRLEDLRPGDRLYFWEHRRNRIGHTGMYLGNGYFVHSSSGRGGVATDDLRAPKWRRLLVAARR